MASRLGLGLGVNRIGGGGRGNELVGTPVGTGWSVTGTGVTVDGTGLHFVSGSNLAAGFLTIPTLDNATYEVKWTVANFTGGSGRIIVYGATVSHGGVALSHAANGTFTDTVTTSGGGSSNLQIRVQAVGTAGTNSFDVTSISVKQVL